MAGTHQLEQRDTSTRAALALAEEHDSFMPAAASATRVEHIGLENAVSVAALPRVDGRHGNRALAAARRARAIELRAQGWTYEQIADELGYANRGTVCHIVTHALKRQEFEAAECLRSLEVARLDAVQSALWGKAMNGDIAAAQACIRIIATRCRLLGLEESEPVPQSTPRTVVVPNDI